MYTFSIYDDNGFNQPPYKSSIHDGNRLIHPLPVRGIYIFQLTMYNWLIHSLLEMEI